MSTGELLWPKTTTPSGTTQAVIYLNWSVEVPRLRVRCDPPFQSLPLRLPNKACALSRRKDAINFDADFRRLRVAVRRPANLGVLPLRNLDGSVERLLLNAGRAPGEKIRALPAQRPSWSHISLEGSLNMPRILDSSMPFEPSRRRERRTSSPAAILPTTPKPLSGGSAAPGKTLRSLGDRSGCATNVAAPTR